MTTIATADEIKSALEAAHQHLREVIAQKRVDSSAIVTAIEQVKLLESLVPAAPPAVRKPRKRTKA